MSHKGRDAASGTRAFSERQFRDALAQFATGVTIICARAPDGGSRAASRSELQGQLAAKRAGPTGRLEREHASAKRERGPAAERTGGPSNRYVGFTANSFSSASLDPPLILWTLAQRSSSLAGFEASARYAVNVLAATQVDLARRFSRPHADRFADVPFRLGWSDAPLIDGCIAWFECRHHARHRTGDHMLFVGEVMTVERSPGQGLVFQHGRFAATTPPESK